MSIYGEAYWKSAYQNTTYNGDTTKELYRQLQDAKRMLYELQNRNSQAQYMSSLCAIPHSSPTQDKKSKVQKLIAYYYKARK